LDYIKYNSADVLFVRRVNMLSEILSACKDLISDAKIGCADLVFKDICLDILAKARLVLDTEQFEELTDFVTVNMKDEIVSGSGRRIRVR
jgi:hypothetical protein